MAKLPCLTSAPMGQGKGFAWRFRNKTPASIRSANRAASLIDSHAANRYCG